MMTSSNEYIFCVSGHLCGEFTGALMFSSTCAWMNGWVNNREASDLRRHGAHYDVTIMVMIFLQSPCTGCTTVYWTLKLKYGATIFTAEIDRPNSRGGGVCACVKISMTLWVKISHSKYIFWYIYYIVRNQQMIRIWMIYLIWLKKLLSRDRI